MLAVIAFGLAAGAALQAWRNFPPDGPMQSESLALLFVVGVVCAYLGGRSRRPSTQVAIAQAAAFAEAKAENTNTVNLAVVLPGGGARPHGVVVPDMDDMPWMVGERPQLDAGQLDGMDLAEFAEDPVADPA